MKCLIVFLLCACFTAIYATIGLNNADRTRLFHAKYERLLSNVALIVNGTAKLSPKERLFISDFYVIVFDFDHSQDERTSKILHLCEEYGTTEKETMQIELIKQHMFHNTELIEAKMPLNRKQILTSGAKLIANDDFMLGSRESRRIILLREILNNIRTMRENPKMMAELQNAQKYEELKEFLKFAGMDV